MSFALFASTQSFTNVKPVLLKPVRYTFSRVVAVPILYTFIATPRTCL
nr:MAG TPA: hypothetical protein [Caudoviricetes sp.]